MFRPILRVERSWCYFGLALIFSILLVIAVMVVTPHRITAHPKGHAGSNLLINGDFEAGDFSSWEIGTNTSAFIIDQTYAPATGNFAAQVFTNNGEVVGGGTYCGTGAKRVPVATDRVHSWGGYIRVDPTSTNIYSAYIQVSFWYGCFHTFTSLYSSSTSVTTANGQWTWVQGQARVPAGYDLISVHLKVIGYAQTGPVHADFDTVTLVEGTELRPPPLPTITPVPPTPIPPRCPRERYTDVCPQDYFYTPVNNLADMGVISGYSTAPPCASSSHVPCFKPADNVTRGQVAKIISIAAGFNETVNSQAFEDVPFGHPFYYFIGRLAGRGIIGGYPCGGTPQEPCVPGNRPYFRVGTYVTRGQLSKMLSEAFGYSETPSSETFVDVVRNSTFYLFIERLSTRGIINGYACGSPGELCDPNNRPYFRPNNSVTRGQAAKMVDLARAYP